MVDQENPPKSDRKCSICGSSLGDDVKLCMNCKSIQPGKECVTCSTLIALNAHYCNACKTYQGWRRYVSVSQVTLSLLVALVAVFPNALNAVSYFRDYHSHTSAVVSSADAYIVSVYAWNTGRKPSTLVTFKLTYGAFVLKPADLDPTSRVKTVVPKGDHVTLDLRIPPLRPDLTTTVIHNLKPELIIGVMESNGEPRDLPPLSMPASFEKDIVDRLEANQKGTSRVQ